MQTSPALQLLSPHAKSVVPASTGQRPEHTQPPLFGSHVAWQSQLGGQKHGGGGPPQIGGGHGGVGGQTKRPCTQTSGTLPPLHPPLQIGGPCWPSTQIPPEVPLDEDVPEDEPEPPEEEEAPEELEPLPPELLPELDEEPGSGLTTLPPHAATTPATRTVTAARMKWDRGEGMAISSA